MRTDPATSALPTRPLAVIGNPENRRVGFFLEAARRLGLPPPRVMAYERLLAASEGLLADAVPRGALVRIESPGENTAVEQGLIRLGAQAEGIDERETARAVGAAGEHGRIAAPRLWLIGFRRLLERIEAELAPRHVCWMNHPGDIPLLFDKTACQRLLASRGVPIPPLLHAAGESEPASYDALRQQLDQIGWPRAFVKLRYGSSASGVIAFERSRGQVRATTSVELVQEGGQTKLFNSLRVRRYERESDVAAIVDALAPHGLHVERWLPKAGFGGRTFDLRVVVIAAQACHLAMRTSNGPITNLHLGNRRGDVAALSDSWPAEHRQAAFHACANVAAAFPRSHYFGIDLLLLPGLIRHAIVEVNAFGDLLPGILHAGDDTYTAELRSAGSLRSAILD